ncbi:MULTISPECIES: phosphatase PAP2 family protein [Bifidobacterium]|jgi:membrane-associated phospholipid phosphatase|uniref:Phosphatase PAP2 family protein n=1 Tax=Bifidobacterium tibiigranuli TaxID=2172043 RepID=A0A5N6S9F9_9BIFI|nr:phosphatase PAP2 family protein [Bifidobacterium tibiigranuli]KAE8130025.1 phosphatase PAP2 family protein [Bifidobacterium tibiigranuli]KAE8130617.1 acid phosphatase [Bifidobacterium tibiigranuli]MCI1221002.1 phosphatase PAP2 family protein [Bifidobacterium tibiigranuli]
MHKVMAGAAALAMLLSGGAVAQAAQASTAYPANKPNITELLGEFNNWWTPKKVVDNTAQGDAFRGSVTDAGRSVLAYSDDTVVAINNHAAKDTTKVDGTDTQAHRAAFDASDSPANAITSYSTALGDTIGKYLREGLSNGSLPKTNALVFDASSPVATSGFVGTGSAKKDFNYPRPYFTKADQGVDRTIGGDTNLNGLKPELGIIHIPMFTQDGQEFGEDYTDYEEPSQAFPSGHTTKAYNRGIALSTLLPELGPEIMARASEAGNNRVVLGVHYPMDVMGGRIAATASSSALWSDSGFRTNELLPAHDELENYIAARCKADGNGSTVGECVTKLGANADKGYVNTFTDVVSTKPVTDRASAIDAYTSRMTYGFAQTSAAGQAPKVPAGAEDLLLTAFPDLSVAQRRQILEASEIDSGYPLDASSQGYQRLNLAKAYSANVTLSADGSTIVAISFGNAQSKVTKVSDSDAVTNLLKDFNRYFVAGVGVTDEGKAVLSHDDQLTESINHAAFRADGKTVQDQRALSDAQMNSTNTLYDALGPVLGAYFKQAADSGKLPKTEQYLKDMNKSASTGSAKAWYQHPRPYVDRVNYVGTTLNMNGTAQTLNIQKVPGYESFDWGNGSPIDNEYDNLYNSGSFPSGHTTFAFTQGTGLASILPELGPQIMTRVSEAGNNRIVLGVHYPLDILGGHIAGQYGVANALNDDTTRKESADARAELVGYLTAQCKADGHGNTLQTCIDATGANDAKGYANAFTDEVSTKPVTDLQSALAAYQARMSYGFATTGTAGQTPVVPDAAVNLLSNVSAFSVLSADQKKQVLAATEGDSGYPLDATSEGWARVNLAAAYSAKVTLSADGKNITKVEPGQTVASVVREKSAEQIDNGGNGNAGTNNQQPTKPGKNGTGASNNKPQANGVLAATGADISAAIVAVAALALIGSAVTVVARKRRH